jgi:hypothetical protein
MAGKELKGIRRECPDLQLPKLNAETEKSLTEEMETSLHGNKLKVNNSHIGETLE